MKYIILLLTVTILVVPVQAIEFEAPEAPSSAEKYMPEDTESFWEGFWEIVKVAIAELKPSVASASRACAVVIIIILILSLLDSFTELTSGTLRFVGAISIGCTLISPTNTLISLALESIQQVCEYTKLLIPVLCSATAAQGATSTSAALYMGTTAFNYVLSSGVARLIVPLIYFHIVISLANGALGEDILQRLGESVKGLIAWGLKVALFIFSGYISITSVISGTADATAIKATKLAISGFVPVVGGALSDASETIILSTALMKHSVGIYGMFVIISICCVPFLRIALQYLLLKLTTLFCSIWAKKGLVNLINDFTTSMAHLLAVTGTVCLVFMVSIVCLMKGITYG